MPQRESYGAEYAWVYVPALDDAEAPREQGACRLAEMSEAKDTLRRV